MVTRILFQTVKGAYVIGSILLMGKSIYWLQQHLEGRETTYIPRFLLIMSCVELLGCCTEGENRSHKPTLIPGLLWVFNAKNKTDIVAQTKVSSYTVEDLESMRHFSAHGQATATRPVAPKFASSDEELINTLLGKLGKALAHYWHKLLHEEDQCKKLAYAAIDPINGTRILQSWKEFEYPYRGITQIFKDILNGKSRT